MGTRVKFQKNLEREEEHIGHGVWSGGKDFCLGLAKTAMGDGEFMKERKMISV